MNKKVISALSSLGIPVAYMEYTGSADNYIVFQVYDEEDTDYADNENDSETFYIQLSHWYKDSKDFDKNKTIKSLMKQAGFKFDGAQDLKDKKYYGKNQDFIYKNYLTEEN